MTDRVVLTRREEDEEAGALVKCTGDISRPVGGPGHAAMDLFLQLSPFFNGT